MKIVKISLVLIVMLALIYIAYVYLIKPSDISTEKPVTQTVVSNSNNGSTKTYTTIKTDLVAINKDQLLLPNEILNSVKAGDGRG